MCKTSLAGQAYVDDAFSHGCSTSLHGQDEHCKISEDLFIDNLNEFEVSGKWLRNADR